MNKLQILSLLLCFLVLNGHALESRNKIVVGKSAFAIGSFLTEMRNMGDIDMSLSAGSTMNAENGSGQLEALADRMSTRASPELHAKFLSSLPRPLEDQEYWAAHAADFDNHVHNFLAHALSATHHEDLPEFLETGARSGSQEDGCTSTENCEAIEGFFARNACKARRGTANTYNGARNWADDKVGGLIGADELKSAMESVNQVNRKLESVPQGGSSQGLTFVDILVALLFGLFNGFTMGLGEALRQDMYKIRDDPVCQRSFAAIKSSFLSIITSVFNLLYGTFSRRARNCMTISDWLGAHINQTIQHFGRLFTAIWELVTTCEPLQKLLFMLGFMLVICLIFVLILWALPGVGWIAYIVGVVMTVIFGVPFLWNTIKKLARGISTVSSNGSDRQAWISIIEAVAEIVGFVACILLTSGAMKLITKAGRAEIMAMVSRNAMAERLGATFRPNPRAIDMVRRFAGMTKAAEDGVSAAKAAEMAAFSKQTPPITQNADEAAQAAARQAETAAARQPRVTPPETPRAPARRTPPVEAPPSAPISAVDDTARSATTAASTTDETARITAGAEGAAIVDDAVKPTIAREGGPAVNTADEAARVEGAVANTADDAARVEGAAANTADDGAKAAASAADDAARNAAAVTEAEAAVSRATEKVSEVTNSIRTKTRELERLLEAQRNEVPRTVRNMEHRGNGKFDLGPERTVASRYPQEINKVRSEISALERQAAQARANLASAEQQLASARSASAASASSASVVVDDASVMQQRMSKPEELLGSVDDLTKATQTLSAEQIADDAARVARGQKPSWAGPEPGGIIGAGPPKQTQFWDETAKCWRNGPGSFDPKTGQSLAGRVVDVTKDHKGISFPGPDVCKINPAFCSGNKPPFCEIAPTICATGNNEILGMSRTRMPQIEDEAKFLDMLSQHNHGKKVTITETTMNPSTLTPTQAEINLLKTQGLGDAIAAGKAPAPKATYVSRDGYIVDGHHRWSAVKWAEANGAKPTFNVKVIDMDIKDIIKSCVDLIDGSGSSTLPEAVKFASLLASKSSYGSRSDEYDNYHGASRQEWKRETMQRLRDAGIAPKDGEATLDAIWDSKVNNA